MNLNAKFSNQRLLAVILFLFLNPYSLWAQINLSLPVGSTAGMADVTPQGSLTYSIPITVPVGTNKLTPSFALVYNSQAGDDIAGWGWTLSGNSVITRSGKTNVSNSVTTPVNYNNTNDVFVLDGNRLSTLTGINGENGTTYSGESETYDKIESFGGSTTAGPEWFKVTTKDGVVMEYGRENNSRVIADSIVVINVSWYLSKVTDVSGNSIKYAYIKIGRAIMLSYVQYSTNSIAGTAYLQSIGFAYENRTDKNTSYDGGVSSASTYRLSAIQCNIANVTGVRKEYRFLYTTIQGQSFLQSITEVGAGGTGANPLNPTRFEYGVASTAVPLTISPSYNFLNNGDCITGDFNGDGKSDILRANYFIDANGVKNHTGYNILSDFTSTLNGNLLLSSVYSYTYTTTNQPGLEVLGVKQNSLYNFLSNDYDGDGKDDVATIRTATEASTQKRLFSKMSINYTRRYTSAAGFSYETADYAQMPYSSTSSLPHKYIFQNGKFFIPGDFDGDGNQDYILVLGINSIDGFKGFFCSPKTNTFNKEIANFGAAFNSFGNYYATSIANADEIIPMDFNGDGKTELLVVKGTASYIVSISPVAPSSGYLYASTTLYSTTQIAKGYKIYPGDFNGDGKTDLLVRPSATTSSTLWKIYYSTGTSLVPAAGNFPFAYTVILPGDNSFTQAHHLVLSDMNRDGKTDVLHMLDLSSTQTRYAAYYSTGDNAFLSETNTVASTGINGEGCMSGDFDSDGKSDLAMFKGFTGRIATIYPFKQDRLMSKVTNGIGHVSTFNYTLLTGTISGPDPFYQRSITYAYDNVSTGNSNHIYYTVPQFPMYCISSTALSNGINGTSNTNYYYQDAVLHKGRGFLGFKKMTSLNSSNQYITTLERDINTQFFIPYNTKQTVSFGVTPITESRFTTSFIPVGFASDRRYFNRADKVINIDYLSGSASEVSSTFDNYGNITSMVTKKGVLSGTTVTPVETHTVNTVYSIHNTPVPSLPDNVTVIDLRSGQPQLSETRAYTYTPTGLIATSTEFSGQPKATTITNTYDAFGNLTQAVQSATGISSRTQKYTYDPSGLHIIKKELLENGISRSESFSYHPLLQTITNHIAFDGLSTSYAYDVFGRLSTTTRPEGFNVTNTMQWESTDGVYSILTSQPGGGPNVKVWYDVLNREVKRQTLGYNNQWLTQTQQYDAKGNINSRTNPYYPSETPVTITASYDIYNRLTYSGNSNHSATLSYANPTPGIYKITSTSAGKSKTSTADAAGKTIIANDNGGVLNYTYDSKGNLSQVANGSNVILMSKTYDIYNRPLSATDKDAGGVTYEYNAFGEQTKQTDANGNITETSYDNLGRISSSTGSDGTTSYAYFRDAATGYANNSPVSVTAPNGVTYNYEYDNLRRLKTESRIVDGTTYSTQYAYNTYSDLITTTYPSGIISTNTVDRNGTLTGISAGAPGNLNTIFTNTGMNSLGQLTSYTLGNGKLSQNTYNMATATPSRFYTAGVQDLNLVFDGSTGNLTSRNDALKGLTEEFSYDYLDRLTQTKLNNTIVSQLQYDGSSGSSMGNITTKTDAGNYVYNSNKIHAVNYILNPQGAQAPPSVISMNQQQLTYTPRLKTATVSENNYEWSFLYGPGDERVKSTLKLSGTETERKYYIGDYEKQVKGNITRELHYIRNNNGLCAILLIENGVLTPYFIYTDHLGSILTATTNSGAIAVSQSFDAWGRFRDPNTWLYSNVPVQPDALYRGYTGHEHIPQSTLINMNGRMYDPVTGRMLSPDNYTQQPYNTQSYNRYSYTVNNPLKYTDPSGNFFTGFLFTMYHEFMTTGLTKGGFEFWNWGSANFTKVWKDTDPFKTGTAANNALKIDLGVFKTDPNKSTVGRIFQFLQRVTWENEQQTEGGLFGHYRNLTGNVSNVDYYNGATLINFKDDGTNARWGLTLGSYINSQNLVASPADDMFRHEFGHTLQSQIMGPLYTSRVGIFSLIGSMFSGENDKPGVWGHSHSSEWYETGANRMAKKYFERYEPQAMSSTPWNEKEYPTKYEPNWYWFISSPLPSMAWWLLL
jgi:RHS repeat-associated protein